ncbi:hypothetical protein HBH98_204820 [Parastagonospora nodorum]|nr:hypothetical protein HBI09_191480 [Parastagonospora nodorum]KAH4286703.1 hypothetical protein HBI02_221460 [Parastagonospora nodorum]KAH4289114.1 hypothetical protein HBI01_214450 [Parastagonospora nodorum]KAH4321635.1 hypothetical protein HBI00_209450 [Parastagonospora nodorum]KAH4339472.1 hypothetical protein HBH98_204820 [Parastagonospora nodorum]
MHQPQLAPHTALPSTFLALLLTTLALTFVMPTPPTSITKTVVIFLAILAATLTAARYIITSPADPENDAEFDFKDAIRRRRERGVLDEKRFKGVFGWGDERRLKRKGGKREDGGEEKREERKARAERRREKEVRRALKREFWPTRGQMLGASREVEEGVVEEHGDEE